MADMAGVHPVSLGPLPDAIAKLMTVQVNVQQLAVEAAVHASKELALQALLIDPVVNSAAAAEIFSTSCGKSTGPISANASSAPAIGGHSDPGFKITAM